jgi:antitoxin FitA
MASIVIRRLEDATKKRLRVRAARHGRSMEEEAREILRSALREKPDVEENLATSIRRRFAPLGGIDLPLLPREPMRLPPTFDK